MSPGRAAAPTALLASLALSGCVGSTEPATNVQAKQATLNARGTANNGPATSFFESWPTGAPDLARRTDGQRWPAGASGPFSETAQRLAADQPYPPAAGTSRPRAIRSAPGRARSRRAPRPRTRSTARTSTRGPRGSRSTRRAVLQVSSRAGA